MAAPRLEFQDITFTIEVRGGAKKELLSGITGWCEPGTVTALSGPSGGGKTTLLDALAGAHYGGRLTGHVLVDGQQAHEWREANTAAYVHQHDVLPALDTPREALTLAALLRLPLSMPLARKLRRVEELLEVLELGSCADLCIGDSTFGSRGLSGGQRRRVTIGIELVKHPSLMLLDEPLSGLDSEMSVAVAASLARLARRGTTILMSLHQASGVLASYIGGLVLLGSGRLVYCGPYDEGPVFLQSLGHKMLPDQSPSEFMLSVLSDSAVAEEAADQWAAAHSVAAAADQGGAAGGGGAAVANGQPKDLEGGSAGSAPPGRDAAATLAPRRRAVQNSVSLVGLPQGEQRGYSKLVLLAMQVWLLVVRNFRWMRRDRATTFAIFATSVIGGGTLGLVFLDMSTSLEEGSRVRQSLAYLLTMFNSYYGLNSSIAAWQQGRVLVRREHSVRLYGMLPCALATGLTWAPVVTLRTVLFSVCYWMAHLQFKADKYFIYLAAQWLMNVSALSLGTIIAVLTPSPTAAAAIQAAVIVLLVTTNGFLAPPPPVYLEWVYQSSYLGYGYAALVTNEFAGLTLVGPDGKPVTLSGPPQASMPHAGWSLGAILGMQAGQWAAFWAVMYLSMAMAARLRRL